MEHNTNSNPTLRAIYDRLGPRNQSVNDTLKLLASKDIKASRASVYQTIHGRSQRREVVEAFLEVAATELERRKQAEERTRQLASPE